MLAGCGADGGERTVQVQIGEGETHTVRGTDGRTITAAPGGEGRGGTGEVRAAACEDAGLEPTAENLQRVADATLCLVNAERRERDLEPLEPSAALTEAARGKARDMAEENYFAHVGPGGRDITDWVRGTGYLPPRGGYTLGENIAWAEQGAATPHRIVEGWMASPTHRRNILARDFRDSGIGVVAGVPTDGAEPGATYAHIFGSPTRPG